MELNQIRYFLAVARALNFTQAARECSVSQPALSRAIKTLEYEFGGELFKRERRLTYLTNLGARILPLCRQCFESAAAARSVALAMKTGALTPLKLAVASSINSTVLERQLTELARSFAGMELIFVHGAAQQTIQFLKQGEAELGLAGPLDATWERLDRWPLFTEPFVLALNERHRFAQRESVALEELRDEALIRRWHCESRLEVEALLRERGLAAAQRHQAGSESDVAALLAANLGVALVPASAALPSDARRIALRDAQLRRTVWIYAVAGRERSSIAKTLLNILRASEWTHSHTQGEGRPARTRSPARKSTARRRAGDAGA